MKRFLRSCTGERMCTKAWNGVVIIIDRSRNDFKSVEGP